MSVIIRLQNLPWSANSLDIRTYFQGLSIPEGGVHIVGGELGDAFIAFSTDEDARQAMLIDGGKIKEVKIKLLLSSRSEMQKVIETARAQSMAMQSFLQIAPTPIPTTALQVAQIPPTPVQTAPAMPVMTHLGQIPPKTGTPEVKPPILPPLEDIPTPEALPDPTKRDNEFEKKDQGKDGDKDSLNKDNKRNRRRTRSRSKNKSRSKSKDRSKSRDRSRSRDRYRSRRDRKRRDRSRDRSRDRRDRRRYRDRSRSRDRSRKSSREKKRDTDRSSLENGRNVEKDAVPPPQNVVQNTVGKPGFKSSGWVSAGTADKPLNPVLPSGSTKPNISQPSRKDTIDSTLLPPIPNRIQPSLVTPAVPLQMPPSFPMDVLKNPDGSFPPIPFPGPASLQNVPFTQNQVIKPEGESLQLPGVWPPMMGVPPGMNLNATMGGNLPQFMNAGMGMFVNPSMPQPPGHFPAPFTNDPRVQTTFPQQRDDFRTEKLANDNDHFHSQKGNFPGEDFDSANRDYSSNSCLEIRNMPLNTNVIDIKRFFQGINILRDGIKIITDKKGNKVGMAYVRFTKPFYKDLALKKTGQMLKNSVVELLPIEDQIFDKTPDFSEYKSNFSEGLHSQGFNQNFNEFSKSNIPAEPFTDLIIHEVPAIANDVDIYNIFKSYSISDAFVLLRMGMKNATGYVRFQNPAEARRALMNSSRLHVRYKCVKAEACYETEFDDARDRKNMEEIDEEMNSSDNYDTGGPFHTRDSSFHLQEPRYKHESRPLSKGLLPTPSSQPFGPRDPRANNFQSHSDRRSEDLHKSTRGGYQRRPYDREDYHDRPPRERSRFAPREMNDPRRRPPTHNNSENHQEDQERSFFVPRQPEMPTPTVKDQPKVEPPTTSKPDSDDRPNPGSKDIPKTDSDDRTGNDPNLKKKVHNTPKTDQTTEPKPKINNDKSEVSPPVKRETIIAPQLPELQQTAPLITAKDENHSIPDGNRERQIPGSFADTDCLILKGLPYSATDRDILDFFSDEGLAPTQIHIMLDKQEKPAGDAFCEFSSVEEVERALSKNQTLMGRSVVLVEAVSREQMMEALGTLIPHHEPSYPDFPEYPPRHQQFYHPRGSHSRYPPPFPPRGRGRGAFRGRFHHPPSNRDVEGQNVNAFGKPGCVLALENVPFRAEVNDILDFFRGYHLTKDNVIRRFDENGKPTGDARVCLDSPAEAQRALRTLNHGLIINRKIFLTLVP